MGLKLFNRIGKHRSSIEAVESLDVAHFQVRALTVAPTWIPLAEVVAIRMHNPVWNVIADGLGNRDTRRGQIQGHEAPLGHAASGSALGPKLAARPESAADIQHEIIEYLRTHRP